MLLPILKYGALELKTVSKPVDAFDAELEKLARNMIPYKSCGTSDQDFHGVISWHKTL